MAMMKQRNPKSLLVLLVPIALILGGAGLAALGVAWGSLALIVAGLVVAAAGVVWIVLWSVLVLELSNPFDWF